MISRAKPKPNISPAGGSPPVPAIHRAAMKRKHPVKKEINLQQCWRTAQMLPGERKKLGVPMSQLEGESGWSSQETPLPLPALHNPLANQSRPHLTPTNLFSKPLVHTRPSLPTSPPATASLEVAQTKRITRACRDFASLVFIGRCFPFWSIPQFPTKKHSGGEIKLKGWM